MMRHLHVVLQTTLCLVNVNDAALHLRHRDGPKRSLAISPTAFVAPRTPPGTFKMTLHRGRPSRARLGMGVSLLQTASSSAGIGSALGAPVVDIFGQIRVGTPPQQFSVAIDTVSANLVLTSSKCRSVGCLAHRAYDADASSTAMPAQLPEAVNGSQWRVDPDAGQVADLDISTGQVQGAPVTDLVCLGLDGDLCAPTSFLEMTRMSQEPFNKFPYDGVLGVGMPAASMAPSFNFLGNLAEAGLMKQNRFAVWLATETDVGENSEITFGDFDENRLGSEIMWVPTSRRPGAENSTGVWQATLNDASVEGTRLDLCGTLGCQAAFDTGTSVIGGPEGFISSIVRTLNVDEDCANYDRLPMLGFHFGLYTLRLERGDYVKRVGTKCYHQFLAVEVPAPKGPLVLLGDPFLRRYMTIFDRDSLQIGMALAVHKPARDATDRPHDVTELMSYAQPA